MTPWEPILDGALAQRAEAALADIAVALQERKRTLPPKGAPVHGLAARAASLATGDAGLALFWAYRHLVDADQPSAGLALGYLDAAIDAVAQTSMSEGLYSGFSGIAWVAEHLRDRMLQDRDDMNEGIDQAILGLIDNPRAASYDLILGHTGLGVYAIERLRYASGRKCLAAILGRLEQSAQRRNGRATWFTPPAWSSPHQRTYAPDGHYNLGLAHGVPGVIGLLGSAIAAGGGTPRSRPLLDEAVAWLLQHAGPDERSFVFSTYFADGRYGQEGRSAWCYGDPGVASAVLVAARATGNLEWEHEAIGWMRKLAERPKKSAGVRDTGLCHGSAGLAHIFNRFYQATGIEQFRDAARIWFCETLDMRRSDAGVAGFPAWIPPGKDPPRWEDHPGLLSGTAGVGLALLAATTAVEPAWDRCMLTDLPLRRAD